MKYSLMEVLVPFTVHSISNLEFTIWEKETEVIKDWKSFTKMDPLRVGVKTK
jgi:hypothetical protein